MHTGREGRVKISENDVPGLSCGQFNGNRMDLHRRYENIISKKKPSFPISKEFIIYLARYQRYFHFNISYDDLLRWDNSFPVLDKGGKDTLWRTVMYTRTEQDEINDNLLRIYVYLTAELEHTVMEHLKVESVDYCLFGNSNPFRIKVRNLLNDNYDYYYIKRADASRVYGLELEEMLSPNKVFYLVNEDTLVEQHISGIPGDQFLRNNIHEEGQNLVRLTKEFVKFNQRCFIRLLGDMRSYNFVVDMTPDFDQMQYRIRAIDFDQQCYEGRMKVYLPQFFKENFEFVDMAIKKLGDDSITQYQNEERSLMRRRVGANRYQLQRLIKTMRKDHITDARRLGMLKRDLADYHKNKSFIRLTSMGAVLYKHINLMLELDLSPVK